MIKLRQLATRLDRAWIFLGLVLVLYIWDVAYFVGIREPYRVPHPFSLFNNFGDIEILRGFSTILREIIFSFASGILIGIPLAAVVLYNHSLSVALPPFLRVISWLPLLMIFAITQQLSMWISAVALCASYQYITARVSLCLHRPDALKYAAREAFLHALFACLIAQMFVSHWQWPNFAVFMNIGLGVQVLATLVVLVAIVNWCFKFSFEIGASSRAAIINQELERKEKRSLGEISVILASTLLVILPLAIFLIFGSEIPGHIGLSLLEVICGLGLGWLAAQITFELMIRNELWRKLVFLILPLTYISAIVL